MSRRNVMPFITVYNGSGRSTFKTREEAEHAASEWVAQHPGYEAQVYSLVSVASCELPVKVTPVVTAIQDSTTTPQVPTNYDL